MASKQHNSAEEVRSTEESCSSGGHCDTARQGNPVGNGKTAVVLKGAPLQCVHCGKKLDGWRALQQHKRNSCANTSWQFRCRECEAFFPSDAELKSHVSAAHVSDDCDELQASSCGNEFTGREEIVTDLTEVSKNSHTLKRKKVHKHQREPEDSKRVPAVRCAEHCREVVKTCTVGSNPFHFTTVCAPDAASFPFLCQSCLTVRCGTFAVLRQHEEWCARVGNSQGFLCLPCGRHYRNLASLRRHAVDYHKVPVSSETKKLLVANPFRFSTTLAVDAASYPHACSSCRLVCFDSPAILRRHEDWCGQRLSAEDDGGPPKCDRCGRRFRTGVLLERHAVADSCTKSTSADDDDDGRSSGVAQPEGTDGSDVGTTAAAAEAAAVHGSCPLCDIPFESQYERLAHFTNVHDLTSTEVRIKQSQTRRVASQVTCLDCDRVFSTRLELFQHKRVCTKEKQFTEVLLPASTNRKRGRPPEPTSFSTDNGKQTGFNL